ncbi:hypothetical protein EUTSA_v10009251mg [Eutrema salsugineum]|uniref:Uncharacterized protein n=1 Tax=Eutrema salsugineum TaxID=72664 RepID=V4MQU2_EUTSA|nr:hypothetical protein EUTSA_v10009251mg [Eutrema salsugineum]
MERERRNTSVSFVSSQIALGIKSSHFITNMRVVGVVSLIQQTFDLFLFSSFSFLEKHKNVLTLREKHFCNLRKC